MTPDISRACPPKGGDADRYHRLKSFFFFKQKTAYEMSIGDWSSDVCSSDLEGQLDVVAAVAGGDLGPRGLVRPLEDAQETVGKIGRASCRERVSIDV